MINFYRRFIPSAAKIMPPLFSALSGKANGLKPLVWTDDMLKAFNEAKKALAEAALYLHIPIRVHPWHWRQLLQMR